MPDVLLKNILLKNIMCTHLKTWLLIIDKMKRMYKRKVELISMSIIDRLKDLTLW